MKYGILFTTSLITLTLAGCGGSGGGSNSHPGAPHLTASASSNQLLIPSSSMLHSKHQLGSTPVTAAQITIAGTNIKHDTAVALKMDSSKIHATSTSCTLTSANPSCTITVNADAHDTNDQVDTINFTSTDSSLKIDTPELSFTEVKGSQPSKYKITASAASVTFNNKAGKATETISTDSPSLIPLTLAPTNPDVSTISNDTCSNKSIKLGTTCSFDITPNKDGVESINVSTTAKDVSPARISINSNLSKHVTVYLLLDKTADLTTAQTDLNNVSKLNFDRVVLSFVDPNFTNYSPDSLAGSGILGYYHSQIPAGENPTAQFSALKKLVQSFQAKHAQVLVSIGGWNYSNPSTAAQPYLDSSFPDPSSDQTGQAQQAYTNIAQFTSHLGADGIDVDYEEFNYASQNAIKWDPSTFGKFLGGYTNGTAPAYSDIVHNAGTPKADSSGMAIMPSSVNKLSAITHALNTAIDTTGKNLILTMATGPVNATPIMSTAWGDNDQASVYKNGGIWWQGNLKGLLYNLAMQNITDINSYNSVGIMTYDLSSTDAPFKGAAGDLQSQVSEYMGLFNNFLKNPSPTAASVTPSSVWGGGLYAPAHFNTTPSYMFGFEINTPAYPKTAQGRLDLTNTLADSIIKDHTNDSGGDIIWAMYSVPASASVSVNHVLDASCNAFLKGNPNFDCTLTGYPSVATQQSKVSSKQRKRL